MDLATTTSVNTEAPLFSLLNPNFYPSFLSDTLLPNVENALSGLAPFSFFLSFLFLSGVIYATIQITRIRAEQRAYYLEHVNKAKVAPAAEAAAGSGRWQKVVAHIESPNSSEWRLAIIEADIMLEEMVEVMGYRGENLGEKLRQVEEGNFRTINKAWEAHRVRNMIAHQGANFELTEREAKRIINLYEDVFNEFRYI